MNTEEHQPAGPCAWCEVDRQNEEMENEKLRFALERIERHGPIMGSTGEYRQGQLDILEIVSTIAGLALASSKPKKPTDNHP